MKDKKKPKQKNERTKKTSASKRKKSTNILRKNQPQRSTRPITQNKKNDPKNPKKQQPTNPNGRPRPLPRPLPRPRPAPLSSLLGLISWPHFDLLFYVTTLSLSLSLSLSFFFTSQTLLMEFTGLFFERRVSASTTKSNESNQMTIHKKTMKSSVEPRCCQFSPMFSPTETVDRRVEFTARRRCGRRDVQCVGTAITENFLFARSLFIL